MKPDNQLKLMGGYSWTLVKMNESKKNDRVKMTNEMITVQAILSIKEPENRQELVQTDIKRNGLSKEKGFEFRVKLMREEGK